MYTKESLQGVGIGRPYGAAALALESLSNLARRLTGGGKVDPGNASSRAA